MQPTGNGTNGAAPRAARLTGVVLRVGIAAAITLGGASALTPVVGADTTAPEPQEAGASNGGVASASTDGNVEIGQIVTGENTGNSIVTGDIMGPAEVDGGEIDYPTNVTVSQVLGPPISTADGGDDGTATVSDDSQTDGENEKNRNGGEDISIINRVDNRSKAKVVEKN